MIRYTEVVTYIEGLIANVSDAINSQSDSKVTEEDYFTRVVRRP